jgi:hypothetical protein
MLKALGILIKNPVGHFEAMQHPDDFVSSIWARNAFGKTLSDVVNYECTMR